MKATMKIIAMVTGLLLSACAQNGLEFGKANFQAKAGKVLNGYASTVSRAFAGQGRRSLNGRGSWGNENAYNTNTMPGYGQLYGGQVIRQKLHEDARDCADMVEMIPPTSEENYHYMLAILARCLDKIAQQSPINQFAYRNLNGQARDQFAYLLNYRRPTTYEDWDSFDDGGMLNSFIGGGW